MVKIKKIFIKNLGLIGLALAVCFFQMYALVKSEYAKGHLIDLVWMGKYEDLQGSFIKFALLMGLSLVFAYLYTRLRRIFVQRAAMDLRDEFFRAFLNLSIKDYFTMEEGHILNKYSKEISQIEQEYFLTLTVALEMAIKLVFVLGAFIALDLRLAILSSLILSAPILVPKYFEARLDKRAKNLRDQIEVHMGKFTSWLNSFELIKNFSIEEKLSKIFDISNQSYRDAAFDLEDLKAQNIGMSFVLSQGAQAFIIIITGILTLRGYLSPGDFVMISGMVSSLKVPTYWLSTLYQTVISTRPVRSSIKDFIKKGQDQDPISVDLGDGPLEAIFENVSYSYQGGDLVLDDFNLVLEPGKKYLISGKSGSGKTTAMNLLMAYDSPDSGKIYLAGRDLADLGPVSDQVIISRQDAILFDDTIRNNVAMFDKSLADEDINRVLSALGLVKGKNYHSLDDRVSEKGQNFSGGEKKRIALARAFVKDCGLLILDEPLANIDPANIQKVEDFILTRQGKTLVVISHQINVARLKDFHCHYVFEGGKAYEKVY